MLKKRVTIPAALLLAALACTAWLLGPWRERGADDRYDTRVEAPALASKRPRVLFDHGHHNSHSISGRYGPFAKLIASDGCRVRQTAAPLTPALLRDADLLVIVNAEGPKPDKTAPAFTDLECDAVRDWVRGGGSLLLVADHHPCGEAASKLAARFGVEMSGGWTDDEACARAGSGDPGQLLFTRGDGRLADHAITRGDGKNTGVDTVETFTGQSLQGPADSSPLLLLSPTALDRIPVSSTVQTKGTTHITTFETSDHSAAGRTQGLAMRFGNGRLVVLGEAAMLTAQINGRGNRFGMNAPGNDDRAFALNLIRWLAGGLDD